MLISDSPLSVFTEGDEGKKVVYDREDAKKHGKGLSTANSRE
jgi:hypothetical protein